jgi:dTDP-4-dehydrorhamnose 3,5-epimerase
MKRELLKDIEIIVPEIFSDERGNFSENFNQIKFNEAIKNNYSFVQDNKSFSKKGVFRGTSLSIKSTSGKISASPFRRGL